MVITVAEVLGKGNHIDYGQRLLTLTILPYDIYCRQVTTNIIIVFLLNMIQQKR